METVSGVKEVLQRETVIQDIKSRLLKLGTLGLVVAGKSEPGTS